VVRATSILARRLDEDRQDTSDFNRRLQTSFNRELAQDHRLQNAVSAWRQQAPAKDRKPIAWERAMETLRDALLLAEVADHREAVPGIT
jgi:hypothetical protein